MSDNKKPRRPILYNGQLYFNNIPPKKGGPPKEPKVSYEEARKKIIESLNDTTEKIKSISSAYRLPNELILCLRLEPKWDAKTSYPKTLFDNSTEKFGFKEIGSRIWRKSIPKPAKFNPDTDTGKLFFIRGDENSLKKFESRLNQKESILNKDFMRDVRKLSSIDLLAPEEQIIGIDDWEQGRLEAVLHPFQADKEIAFRHFRTFIKKAGVDLNNIQYKQYEEGITFISLIGNKDILKSIAGYNPLRTLHPLIAREIPTLLRGSLKKGVPMPPEFTGRPSITIGVLDGGIKQDNPLLENYAENIDVVDGESHEDFVEHGTQVVGAALYGPLNNIKSNERLPEPSIYVKSFRILSKDSGGDINLYKCIDAIEKVIPNNPDITVYNLSVGPDGPILDDVISRFTFVCDKLSEQYRVIFCVAVGNDGEIVGYNRIQSPSDMVNGLAVGAYTKRNGEIVKAPYSCVGPGREGNKLKPDILAFGGCDQHPIHVISSEHGCRVWVQGTSYSAPISAAAMGQLIGSSRKVIDNIVSKALLIHSAREQSGDIHNNDFGHGILPEIEDIITCADKSYTLIYTGEINTGKYVEFTIPWIYGIDKGSVKFRWTLAVLTKVDPYCPDDYTTASITTTLYPNAHKFLFTKKSTGQTKRVDVSEDPEMEEHLIENGWTKPNYPVSASKPTAYESEATLKKELKWDSLDSREITRTSKDIKSPFFHLHAIGRGDDDISQKVRYALILTVEAQDANVDLYSEVINNFSALVPLKLQIKTPVTVSQRAAK